LSVALISFARKIAQIITAYFKILHKHQKLVTRFLHHASLGACHHSACQTLLNYLTVSTLEQM